MAVRITSLGTLRIEQDGRTLDRLPAARNRSALLLYLAVEREVSRDRAMDLLWPDRPPERARHLLSQTLYELRQELGDGWMESAGEVLRATPSLGSDVGDMTGAAEAGDHERALELYGGPFLPGSGLAVSRPMEGWIESQRARLVRLHRRARRGAVDARMSAGDLAGALSLARSWAERDPLDDEAQHRLIELLAATGDRSGALRQYDRYERLVAEELELEPLDDTRELVERIRAGEVGERRQEGGDPVPAGPGTVRAPGTGSPAEPLGVAEPGDAEGRGVAEDRRAAAGTAASSGAGADGWLDRLASLKDRRTVQWTLAYLAVAVVLLEGTEILSDTFGFPPLVLRVLAVTLGFGAIVVLGAGWYFGDRRRTFGMPEGALTFLVALFLLTTPVWFGPASTTTAEESGGLPSNRLAVLYFDDLSPSQSLTPLAGGFTEALIHELSQVEGLDVLSRRAVAPFRENPGLPYDTLVKALGAGILVEGSLTEIGDSVRLTIQLIEGATASHLMSTTLSSARDSTDKLLMAMPEEAARLLRKRLGDWVRLQERRTAATSVRALELVQRAEPMIEDAEAVGRSDREASLPLLDRADSMLVVAEREAPRWPTPTMLRARVEEVRAEVTSPVPSHFNGEAVERAFRHLDGILDRWPDYAPALSKRGHLEFALAEAGFGGESRIVELYHEAEADLRQATMEDESLAEAWWGLSRLLLSVNSYAEARRAAVRALEADAFLSSDLASLWHLFVVTFNAEDHPAAEDWCDEIDERYGEHQAAPYCRLLILTSSPRASPSPARAWELADSIVARASPANRDFYRNYISMYVAKVLVRAGLPDSARATVARAVPEPLPDWAAYDVAHIHLLLGEEDRALDVLEQYFEWNPIRAQRLSRDWWFRDLHGHPRFEKLLSPRPG